MRIVKCTELKTMWGYRKKQKKKVSLLESLEKAANDGTGASVVQDGADSAARPERAESVELLPTSHRV